MTTHTTQTLPKHISDEFDERFDYSLIESVIRGIIKDEDVWFEMKKGIKQWFAQTLETEVQKAEKRGRDTAWEEYKQFMASSGVLIYDGAGNLLKFDPSMLEIKKARS